MEQRGTVTEGSEQCGHTSKVKIPPHCPNEVTLWSSHVLRDVSLMGHMTEMQLEVNLMLTGSLEMLAGSVMIPEKVLPAVTGEELLKYKYCSDYNMDSPISIACRISAHHSLSSRNESQVN